MKYLISLLLLINAFQSLHAYSYIDSLDVIIDQEVATLTKSSYKVATIVNKIKKNIKPEVSWEEIRNFFDSKDSIVFLFCNTLLLELDAKYAEDAALVQQSLKNLQCALGAKLYVYYLECAKQKMLYKAVKNYDALNYWQNEKFYEGQSFFKKNILRSLSGSGYAEKIDNNIALVQNVSEQTNAFLGLVIYNQQLLVKATTKEEFEQNLIEAVQLQDKFLDVSDQLDDKYDISFIIYRSVHQAHQFSVDISKQYAQCQLPSHLVRHWEGYTVSSVAICASAFIYMRYGNDIVQGTYNFYTDHVEKPLHENWKTFMGYVKEAEYDVEKFEKIWRSSVEQRYTEPAAIPGDVPLPEAVFQNFDRITNNEFTPAVSQVKSGMKDIEAISVAWKQLKINYQGLKIGVPWTWKPWDWTAILFDNVFPDPDVETRGQEAAFDPILDKQPLRDLSVPFEDKVAWVAEQDHITLSSEKNNPIDLAGATTRLGLKDFIIPGAHQANHYSQKMNVVLGIIALVPVVTLIGGSLFASKSLYDSVAYQPIRTLVRRLEIFLNEIYYEPVTFAQEGHIYFLTEQLKLNIQVLTIPEQKLILADIKALQAPSLDYVQKTNVVHRMYRTYPCLIPARV